MAPAQIPVFLSQKPSTENGQFFVVGLRLAWRHDFGSHLEQLGISKEAATEYTVRPRPMASLVFGALYAMCPYYFVLYMQSVLIIWCLICNVSLLCGALYAMCP